MSSDMRDHIHPGFNQSNEITQMLFALNDHVCSGFNFRPVEQMVLFSNIKIMPTGTMDQWHFMKLQTWSIQYYGPSIQFKRRCDIC